MENKNINILNDVNNNGVRLTITPNRITIKYPKGFSEDKEKYEDFALKVEKGLSPVKQSWRGKFWDKGISMRTNKNNNTKSFFYDKN